MTTNTKPMRWGVLGATSSIATSAVLPAMRRSASSDVVALGTRSGRTYESVIDDPRVEAIYIALPNGLHAEWAIKAAAAHKHILCEKPLAMSGEEARTVVEAAKNHGVTLMEAFMTPFHARWRLLAESIENGKLGDLRYVHSAYTFRYDSLDEFRYDPLLGGGVLLDVGIYVLAPILRVAGRSPRDVRAVAVYSSPGVEKAVSGWLDFGSGLGAGFECSFEAPYTSAFEVTGVAGAVRVRHPFVGNPDDFTGPLADAGLEFVHDDGSIQTFPDPNDDPYQGMVEHFVSCVRTGQPPIYPPDESIALADLVGQIRKSARGTLSNS
jgi:xylose dehydrogenase (NAD/NADP)